jgi:hypothetical protein
MLMEAALLPRNLSSHRLLFQFIRVPVPLRQKSYGSCGSGSATLLPAETHLWMPGPAVDLSGVSLVELLVQDVLVALHTLEQLPTISVYTAQDKINTVEA